MSAPLTPDERAAFEAAYARLSPARQIAVAALIRLAVEGMSAGELSAAGARLMAEFDEAAPYLGELTAHDKMALARYAALKYAD